MKKITHKLKKLLANVVRTILLIVTIALIGIAVTALALPALVISVPLIAILDAFVRREPATATIVEYEREYIGCIAESLNNFVAKLSD